jgi:hypothetical protein
VNARHLERILHGYAQHHNDITRIRGHPKRSQRRLRSLLSCQRHLGRICSRNRVMYVDATGSEG